MPKKISFAGVGFLLLASPQSGSAPLAVSFSVNVAHSYSSFFKINYGDGAIEQLPCNSDRNTVCSAQVSHTYASQVRTRRRSASGTRRAIQQAARRITPAGRKGEPRRSSSDNRCPW